jgi:hypothetical protein
MTFISYLALALIAFAIGYFLGVRETLAWAQRVLDGEDE